MVGKTDRGDEMKENWEYVSILRCIADGVNAIADFEEFGMTETMENWVLKYGEKAKSWVGNTDGEFSNDVTQLLNMISKTRNKMMN